MFLIHFSKVFNACNFNIINAFKHALLLFFVFAASFSSSSLFPSSSTCHLSLIACPAITDQDEQTSILGIQSH